ncbi:(DL)-glycerol-3-phosphatase 1, mitochondrial [Seminavis robusta]|uniref:(DL)-glycerol-3-phosphatase 1, mitochondrial n=1 Tax=Seminavis robusta TaxID=568900 RepID=A0A9N8F4V4_9STRA|nr:(DL)-glycerol-3-phosphatase 1, mitochondrial [Seminavis robusta]|eukprot:Sro3092_g343580.1 (DL)-glycerol-3-phosphatase 1, mitochondrial (255) ;mRNA; f:4803-5935
MASSSDPSSASTGMPSIKAVLFDLDGTLLDTEALSDRANIKNFEGLLPPTVEEELAKSGRKLPWECKKQILGLRASSWVPIMQSYAKEAWGVTSPLSVEEFGLSWESNLSSFCEDIVACEGARDLVETFAKAGLPMAIATSSRKAAVDKKRKRHEDIFKHMATIVCGDDPELENGKPAPDIYLLAANRLGVNPKNCLVFEDAMSGVKSGKAAGCMVVAVPDPRFSQAEKAEFAAIADEVLTGLGDFDSAMFGIN